MHERLTPIDASFLRAETKTGHMHVGWRALLDEPVVRPRPTLDDLRAWIGGRLHQVPRSRQRPASPLFGLADPRWIDDTEFRLARHVVPLAGESEAVPVERFEALGDAFLSDPLDRTAPLWQVGFVPRLDDGRIGLVCKIHHAMVDGLAAVQFASLLFDPSPHAAPTGRDEWRPGAEPGVMGLGLEALAAAALDGIGDARKLLRSTSSPGQAPHTLAHTLRRAALVVREDILRPARPSALNVPIGPRRVLVGHHMAREDLRRAQTPAGVTLNDVCLAAVTGTLRELLRRRGEAARPLKAMVPASVRRSDEQGDLGNRISFVSVDLPVEKRSPRARLVRIREQTLAFKREARPAGAETLLAAAGKLVPAPLRTPVARAVASPRAYNVVISNIPGPDFPVYTLGAELREVYPVVPVADGHALSVGIFSYREHVFFGFHAEPDALPDAHELPAILERETRALIPSKRRPTRRSLDPPFRGKVAPVPRRRRSDLPRSTRPPMSTSGEIET